MLSVDKRKREQVVFSFLLSLMFHILFFVFAIRALVQFNERLGRQKSVEVNLVTLQQPRVLKPNLPAVPRVPEIDKIVNVAKIVKPVKSRIVLPHVEKVPKVENIPKIPKASLKEPVRVKKISINESAIKRVLAKASINKSLPTAVSTKVNSLNKLKKPARVGSRVLSGEAYNELLSKYNRLIRKIIEEHKVYPELARENGMEGKVLVEFKILKNGRVKFIRVIDSSSYDILDAAAVYAIKRSSPFPPIPSKLGKKALKFRVWIKYELGG